MQAIMNFQFFMDPFGLIFKPGVFLRERPQCSSDILRKTPSIFRDLIRALAATKIGSLDGETFDTFFDNNS